MPLEREPFCPDLSLLRVKVSENDASHELRASLLSDPDEAPGGRNVTQLSDHHFHALRVIVPPGKLPAGFDSDCPNAVAVDAGGLTPG